MTLLEKIRTDYEKKLEAEWMPSGEKVVKPLKMNTGTSMTAIDIETMKASIRNILAQSTETRRAFTENTL